MIKKGLEYWNTRYFRMDVDNDNYKCIYKIRLASTIINNDPEITVPEEVHKNALFRITRGDYDLLLLPVVENLKKAKEYASNQIKINMINKT